ncbi:MAG: ArnT family glycosyltransferase [Pseudodesulfovibrio sp.]|uniref:ArnT family glycosyltransferase n=1 Tax=Pseudodesulfovibrio sp. TaxID=2035812 RepID=UPI003D1255F0
MTENKPRFWGTPYVALPLLFVLSFAVRYSFFYTPTIGWDESTFILFGQHILNGGLPYVDYFDIKPPLLFYLFAGAIKLFGATIPAVRAAGAVCVFLAASACYFIGRHLWGKAAGLFAGILCISGMSVGNGMAVLSETVAMAPLMACAYLVIAWNRRGWAMFLAGALMGAAVLIRSNLAYTCLLSAPCVLYILYEDRRALFSRAALYALGGVTVLLLTLYPFYARDALGDLYRAVVLTPLGGANGAMSVAGLKKLLWSWNDGWDLLLVLAACGLYLCFSQVGKGRASRFRHVLFLCSILLATTLSFLGGKTIYGHYILQLVPVLSLFGGYLLYRLHENCGGMRLFCYALALYILLLPSLPLSLSLQRLGRIARDVDAEYHVVASDETETARYIREHLPAGRSIWVMDNHIIYWFLSMEPPAKYLIHPDKIVLSDEVALDSGHKASTIGVIEDVFAERPYFIVRMRNNRYLLDGTPEGDLINATMGRMYHKVAQFGMLGVFRINGE